MTTKQAQAVYDDLRARGFDDSYETGRGRARAIRVKCSQCEALVISGYATHETGCPHQTHECRECGQPTPNWVRCDDCQMD